MTKVRCGWCGKVFDMETVKGKHGYGTNMCPHCGRFVPSSRKESIEGNKHIHSDFKPGEVV